MLRGHKRDVWVSGTSLHCCGHPCMSTHSESPAGHPMGAQQGNHLLGPIPNLSWKASIFRRTLACPASMCPLNSLSDSTGCAPCRYFHCPKNPVSRIHSSFPVPICLLVWPGLWPPPQSGKNPNIRALFIFHSSVTARKTAGSSAH